MQHSNIKYYPCKYTLTITTPEKTFTKRFNAEYGQEQRYIDNAVAKYGTAVRVWVVCRSNSTGKIITTLNKE